MRQKQEEKHRDKETARKAVRDKNRETVWGTQVERQTDREGEGAESRSKTRVNQPPPVPSPSRGWGPRSNGDRRGLLGPLPHWGAGAGGPDAVTGHAPDASAIFPRRW